MRKLVLPLGVVLVVMMPLVVGRVLAGWLVARLAQDLLWGWVLGLGTAVLLTLLFIAGWALYRDEMWQGLMHPLAYIGSIALVLIASLTLPEIAIEPEYRARRVLMYLWAVYVVLGETAVIHYFWERGLEAFLERWD